MLCYMSVGLCVCVCTLELFNQPTNFHGHFSMYVWRYMAAQRHISQIVTLTNNRVTDAGTRTVSITVNPSKVGF